MIEEVLEKVREAEKRAGEEKARAAAKADEIRSGADIRAAEITSSAKKNAKAERSNMMVAALMRAEEEYAKTTENAARAGEKLKLDLDKKAEALAEKIAGEIMSGGGF